MLNSSGLVDGWLPEVRRVDSPNFDARPASEVSLVVIHNISLPPGCYGGDHVERLFTNRLRRGEHPFLDTLVNTRVSAHFYIGRSGSVTQFVSCLQRAWHAGASQFRGRAGCNDFSVGIELEGTDFEPFVDAQYAALNRIIDALTRAFPIEAIVGHSVIAADRKTDPGPFFRWDRITAAASRIAR
ncbi:MAG TPA: 1,6-anhydro-N-acetylmuramyl-L-alanine amidase AmpD [Burkholderiaceae bacterium]|nr:1,6-anhydro-N-acetylmuramyl-L-alanine amidase AmpD [Burkholderiaceae bacterium]